MLVESPVSELYSRTLKAAHEAAFCLLTFCNAFQRALFDNTLCI
jgi:hypothetical protein